MGKKNLVQIPAQIVDFRPKADRSYKIAFNTRELSGVELAILADNFQGEGWLVFSPNEITQADIPQGQADSGMEGKTPSQRLRNVLYVLWEQRGKPMGSFETFKAAQYEKFIDAVKERLE